MQNVSISVIVPIYNVENYLEKCLASLLAQTFQEFEIICIDDGSRDSSGAILDRIAGTSDKIRAFHTENQGLRMARNTGMTYARGEFITFVDSDDSVVPDYLEIMYNEMISNNSDLVACGRKAVPEITQWKKAGSPQIQRLEGDIFGRFCRKEYRLGVEAMGVLYRKKLLPEAPYYPGIYYEDYCFFYTNFFNDINRISIINADMYMLTKSINSIMRSPFSEKKLDSSMTILREIHKNITNFDTKYHKAIYRRTHNNILHRTLRDMLLMTPGADRDALFERFQGVFISLVNDGTLKKSCMRLKYRVLVYAAKLLNPKLFQAVASKLN